ncbi:hypothetical protein NVP1054O_45 [Vibrio phage 1.054.O._10N.261.52.A1]|nr:hypothetical protein NVP1054O_45 [Vibrio phage 1.054.O._10N.261.52.A1]
MAIKLTDEFGNRANPSSPAYPSGSLKDETNPGVSNDGSPLSSRVGNDFQGFMQSALAEAGIDANGNPDSVDNPQILNALKKIQENHASTYTDIVYKASGGNSAVENMIESFNLNPLMHAIGTYIKTGGTTWVYKDSTGPITLENFRAFNVINAIDFGAVPDYDRVNNTGTDNKENLQKCFDYCNTAKKIPLLIGDFGFKGQLTFSRYGITGSDKESDSLYQMDTSKTVSAIIYNNVGGYTTGRGKIKDITLGVQFGVNNGVIEVSTPSDGFAFESAQLRIGTSFGVGLKDSYYINFDNTVFQGKFIDNNDPTIGELLLGQGIKNLDGEEFNNLNFNKCYFQSLSQPVVGSGNNLKGTNTMQFTSCNFERVGDLPLQVRGWHANFTSCYFEKLDQNKSLNPDITGQDKLTKVASGGIGDLTFRNCLINAQDVDTIAKNPDVRLFTGQEQVFTFKNSILQKPDDYKGQVLNYPTYGDAPVLCLESSLGFVDQANGIWEHKNQDKTNVRSEASGKGQIAASPMYADATYAQASYKYATIPSDVSFSTSNPQPFGIIDGRNYNETLMINVEAQQTRINDTSGLVEQMDVKFSAVVAPSLPNYATIVNSSLKTSGSTMFEDADSLRGKIRCYRTTPERVTTPSESNQDPFAYQLAIVGEASPGSTPKILTTISKLEVVVIKNWGGRDLKLGVYQQSSDYAAPPSF